MTDKPQPQDLTFRPLARSVLTPKEACAYLGIGRDGLQRLVDRGEVTPLCYTREHRFLRSELDRFLRDEQEAERARRGTRHF